MANHDRLLAFDTETTINPDSNIGPSPYCPTNRVVMFGWSGKMGDHQVMVRDADGSRTPIKVWDSGWPEDAVWCGHNIKFDIAHSVNSDICSVGAWEEIEIWDTQIGAYLISGQRMRFPSLDGAVEQAISLAGFMPPHDGKLDQVGDYFAAGIGADEIEQDLLLSYFERDLDLTLYVAQQQVSYFRKHGTLDFAISMMRSCKELALMELRGVRVDQEKLKEFAFKLEGELIEQRRAVMSELMSLGCPVGLLEDLDLGKRTWLLKVLFGYEAWPGMLAKPIWFENSLDGDVLDRLAEEHPSPFFAALTKWRKAGKLLNTYVVPIIDKFYRHYSAGSDRIHPRFNPCLTATGRLSSADPNFQNMTSDGIVNIKDLYIPEEGFEFLEYDYKQMEVVALAVLSGDKQLIEDVLNGVDIHNATGQLALGRLPTDGERRSIKSVNFGLIYGGFAKTLSKQANLSIETTQTCIDAFFARYPGVKAWKVEYLYEATKSPREYENVVGGLPNEFIRMHSPSGRDLLYKCYDPPAWKRTKELSPSPTELANYPIQSLATGDISQCMLWVLANVLRGKFGDRAHIVNTVHDSFLIEAHKEIVEEVHKVCMGVLQKAHTIISKVYGMEFDLPLKVDPKRGDRWGTLKKF